MDLLPLPAHSSVSVQPTKRRSATPLRRKTSAEKEPLLCVQLPAVRPPATRTNELRGGREEGRVPPPSPVTSVKLKRRRSGPSCAAVPLPWPAHITVPSRKRQQVLKRKGKTVKASRLVNNVIQISKGKFQNQHIHIALILHLHNPLSKAQVDCEIFVRRCATACHAHSRAVPQQRRPGS
uniref:Uncharacterized protein n=1 Tax=Arundo donax TaxID=35708 RepID=A0A0A8Z251_ARUDO